MKLATFRANGTDELGVVCDDQVISISRAAPGLASDMRSLIADWNVLERDVRRLAEERAHSFVLRDVVLRAPIARPGKILAIGLNYADHIAETGQKVPERQLWFCKQSSAVNGPFDPIQIPKADPMVDYEAELVAVVGTGGKHIAPVRATAAIFGYCVGNDVTARGWQFASPQWVLGKSFDTHAPFGPWITTADEIDPHALGIRAFVNGEKRQDSSTANLVFNVYDQIAHISQAMTLEPGDIVFTGTPGGVGMGMKPPQYLKPDDVVRIEIDRLGALEARCIAEP